MDLIGIENEAEFFPSGTLSDVLKEELQDITSRWSGLDKAAHPIERLSRIAAQTIDTLRQTRNTADQARQTELIREIHHALVSSLGYAWKTEFVSIALNENPVIPIVGRAADAYGHDALWIIEAPNTDEHDEATDPLSICFQAEQFSPEMQEDALLDKAIEEFLADGVFELPNSPRHILVLGFAQIILIDKRKWPARSVLRFDLQEIFTQDDRDTLTVMACLISREARVPDQGTPLSDRLEEEAQRNANAVTTSLKRTVRDAIEILGQEALEVAGGKYPSNFPDTNRRGVWIDGPELSKECLRYMYRLLFLFYAEANPRLKLFDLKNPIYAAGYSLEALRELESTPLRTVSDREGNFLWRSLQKTLGLIYSGLDLVDEDKGTGLRLPAVKVSLLDPESTPLLKVLQLRNEAVQKAIRLLSLRSTGKNTGRISYAKLGIGQLGAVYETLISFTGVVAKTDLIELKPSKDRSDAIDVDGTDDTSDLDDEAEEDVAETDNAEQEDEVFRRDKVDPLAPSWFVPRSRINEFSPEDIVFNGPEARIYPKGSFIYRLAGRDREKSASYYTPEPLARLLVKHALIEQCRDLPADDLLELKILEPAMGSAAFLVETTNQLADLYLERKQKETGKTIPQDQVVIEKQKVRAFIADRNCFGVDLNPIAVELGAISLWLNSLHESDFSPWFGDQLHAGNSLVGARRASYPPSLLTARTQADLWLKAKPHEIGWRKRLPENHVWQWLLPAKDMANFDKDKLIKPFAGNAQEHIKEWRKGSFFKALEPHEVKLTQKLSRVAEALFDQVAEDLAKTREASNDEITIWPNKIMPGNKGLDFHGKEHLTARLTGADHATNTLPYKRLKTAMDAWCALWIWPLNKAEKLPSRAEFLQGLAMILEGGFTPDGSLAAPSVTEFADPAPDFLDQLEPDAPARDLFKAAEKRQDSLFRETNVEALIETFDWLDVAVEVAARERFVHFDLIFADVMKARGGFDLIVGNPPWTKPSWNSGLVLADIDPIHAGRSAADVKRILVDALCHAPEQRRGARKLSAVQAFLEDFQSARGNMEITSSQVMNPFAGGGANNLYRCFVDLAFRLTTIDGYSALIHQDTHLGDPKAGDFRKFWFQRIRKHFNFVNMIQIKNFAEVRKTVQFSINIYSGSEGEVGFDQFTYAYLPSQVEESYSHDGSGPIGGLRDKNNNWNTAGHKKRILRITKKDLQTISDLNGDLIDDVLQTRLPQPFSENMLQLLDAVSLSSTLDSELSRVEARSNVDHLNPETQRLWYSITDLSESDDVYSGTIVRGTEFRELDETVIQGPHIFVANPFYKTPRRVCATHASYDWIDLNQINSSYSPRSNFGVNGEAGKRELSKCRWNPSLRHCDVYRVAVREMVNLTSERSLISAVIPKGVNHINTIRSVALSNLRDLVNFQALTCSVVLDGMYKMSGRDHFGDSDAKRVPWVNLPDTAIFRALQLVCVTEAYADLWNTVAPSLSPLAWSSGNMVFANPKISEVNDYWSFNVALRTEFSRRQALVEIDVLVAQKFGLSLSQLIELYEIYFPVAQKKEKNTYYDSAGNIAWISAKGTNNVGLLQASGEKWSRSAWQEFIKSQAPDVRCDVLDDTRPGGAQQITRHFVGPFTQCDRINDYKRAWAHFEQLKSEEGD